MKNVMFPSVLRSLATSVLALSGLCLEPSLDAARAEELPSKGAETIEETQRESGCFRCRWDGYAPISVSGDHLHAKGEWMFGYRYMYMGMGPMIPGSHMMPRHGDMEHGDMEHGDMEHGDMAHGEGTHGAGGHKHDMTMQMHMAEVMYAPTDLVTLMAMVNFVNNEMEHDLEMGPQSTRAEGLGDTSLTALVGLLDTGAHRVHLNAGLSFPTGDYKDTDNYHTGESSHPYHMKAGSGTYDLLPGVTYMGATDFMSWGLQPSAIIRLGENGDDYTLGDKYRVTGWGTKRLASWMSASVRLTGDFGLDASGSDPRSGLKGPMADPKKQGYEILELGVGANFYAPSGELRGHRLGIEFAVPLAQRVDDGVHETDWTLTAGWQYSP